MNKRYYSFYIDELWRHLLLENVPIGRNHVSSQQFTQISKRLSSNHPLANNISPLLDCNITNIRNERAKLLLEQLSSKHPYLYSYKTSGIINFIRKAKEEHPNHLILLRNGKTYEAFGVDAIIFVEHTDLKPIGNTPHIELDQSELQDVLDKLVKNGFDIAIYQQIVATALLCSSTESSMSNQSFALSQIVSRDTPTYAVDLEDSDALSVLTSDDKGVIGIAHGKQGFSISLINLKDKKVEIHRNLTMLTAIDVINSNFSRVMILQDTSEKINTLFKQFPFVIYYQTLQGYYEDEEFHKAACDQIARRLNITAKFKFSGPSCEYDTYNLNVDCAVALGLSEYGSANTGLHDLVLPRDSLPCIKRYMKLLMLKPPPENIRESIRYINAKLPSLNVPFIKIKPLSITSMSNLHSKLKVDPQFYKDVCHNLRAFNHYMDSLSTKLIKSVFSIVMHDLRLNYKLGSLQKSIKDSLKIIEYFIKTDVSEFPWSLTGIKKLDKLLMKMESFRNHFNEDLIKKQLEKVDHAAFQLLKSISKDYLGYTFPPENECEHKSAREMRDKITLSIEKAIACSWPMNPDILVNKYSIFRGIPNENNHTELYTTEVTLQRGVKRWYISRDVERLLAEYKNVCAMTRLQVDEILTSMNRMLSPYSQPIEIAFHFLVVLQTFASHVSFARSSGWILPTISNDRNISIRNLNPILIDKECEPINIETDGLTILTGPNGIGKTTLMLSLLASSLMSNIGLYLPCESAQIPTFNNYFFLPNACKKDTAVSPLEDEKRFMDCLIHRATINSLVILDNPGTSTFLKYSIGFIAVIIDELSKIGCISVISTYNYPYFMEIVKSSGNCPRYKQLVKREGTCSLENGYYKDTDIEFFKSEMDEKIEKYLTCYAKNYTSMNSPEDITVQLKREESKNIGQNKVSSANICKIIGKTPDYLSDAMDIILKCIKELACCNPEKDIMHLIPDSLPPPSYNYVPVLYVILIPIETNCSKLHEAAIYVGESGNIITRYFEGTYMKHEKEMSEYLLHKNKSDDYGQKEVLNWDQSHTLVVKLKTRREAKLLEKRLIKAMYKYHKRVIILSHRDGGNRNVPALD